MANRAMLEQMVPAFETERKKKKKARLILWCIGFPLLPIAPALFLLIGMTGQAMVALILSVIVLIASFVLIGIGAGLKSSFQKGMERKLKAFLAETVYKGATTNPSYGFTIDDVMNTGFFIYPDRYFGSNYTVGSYDGIPFEEAKYRLQKKIRTKGADGHYHTTYQDYALGTLVRFVVSRNFKARIQLLEKEKFDIMLGGDGLEKVETEYIDFNKKFQMFASDKQLVFYLFTPQVQEKILELERKTNGKFLLALNGNVIYVALDGTFSPCRFPWKEEVTADLLEDVLKALGLPALISETLGLEKDKYQAIKGVNC